jgi:hypothetical protein
MNQILPHSHFEIPELVTPPDAYDCEVYGLIGAMREAMSS